MGIGRNQSYHQEAQWSLIYQHGKERSSIATITPEKHNASFKSTPLPRYSIKTATLCKKHRKATLPIPYIVIASTDQIANKDEPLLATPNIYNIDHSPSNSTDSKSQDSQMPQGYWIYIYTIVYRSLESCSIERYNIYIRKQNTIIVDQTLGLGQRTMRVR